MHPTLLVDVPASSAVQAIAELALTVYPRLVPRAHVVFQLVAVPALVAVLGRLSRRSLSRRRRFGSRWGSRARHPRRGTCRHRRHRRCRRWAGRPRRGHDAGCGGRIRRYRRRGCRRRTTAPGHRQGRDEQNSPEPQPCHAATPDRLDDITDLQVVPRHKQCNSIERHVTRLKSSRRRHEIDDRRARDDEVLGAHFGRFGEVRVALNPPFPSSPARRNESVDPGPM